MPPTDKELFDHFKGLLFRLARQHKKANLSE